MTFQELYERNVSFLNQSKCFIMLILFLLSALLYLQLAANVSTFCFLSG